MTLPKLMRKNWVEKLLREREVLSDFEARPAFFVNCKLLLFSREVQTRFKDNGVFVCDRSMLLNRTYCSFFILCFEVFLVFFLLLFLVEEISSIQNGYKIYFLVYKSRRYHHHRKSSLNYCCLVLYIVTKFRERIYWHDDQNNISETKTKWKNIRSTKYVIK